MPINLSDLKKLESVRPSEQEAEVGDDDPLVVLVKVKDGFSAPDYVQVRGQFGPRIFSAQITGKDLRRLEQDPAVESIGKSTRSEGIR